MRKINYLVLVALLFVSLTNSVFAQKSIDGSKVESSSFYAPDLQVVLDFKMSIVSSDLETAQYLKLTFPAGFTIDAASVIVSSFGDDKSATISGQEVYWGTLDPLYSGPFADGDEFDFSVTVTAGSISGLQEIGYYILGDGYGSENHEITDVVILDEAPSCPAPINLELVDFSSTTAKIGWTEYLGGATEWEVRIVEKGGDTSLVTPVTTTDNPYTVTGLTPNTGYDFYVRSLCSVIDTVIWTEAFTFLTAAKDAWSEGFEDLATEGALPLGMNSSYESFETAFSTSDANTGSGYVYSSTSKNNGWLYSAPIELTVGYEYSLSFWYKTDNIPFGIKAMFGNTQHSDSMIYSIDSVYESKQNYTEFTGTFSAVESGVFYFGINTIGDRPYMDFSKYFIFMDDIKVDLLSTCPGVKELTSNVTSTTSAELSWVEKALATEWQIEYGISGFTPGTGTSDIVSATTYGIIDLTENEDYDFYVRSICSVGDTSDWSAVNSFATYCHTPSALSTDNVGVSFATLKWITTDDVSSVDVEYGTEGFTQGQGTTAGAVTGASKVVSGLTAGTTYQFYVKSDCDFAESTWVGPESFTTLVCTEPSALNVDSITDNSAQLSWTSTEILWNIEWDLKGFTQGNGKLLEDRGNPFKLTGLLPNTEYDYYVQSDCDAENTSDWVGPFAFTTSEKVGVNQVMGNSNVEVYPNPNNGVFDIVVNTENTTDLKIELLNVQGQVIYRNNVKLISQHKEAIDIQSYAKGIYYLRLNSNEGVSVNKIVVR